jgi:hypothetical protein
MGPSFLYLDVLLLVKAYFLSYYLSIGQQLFFLFLLAKAAERDCGSDIMCRIPCPNRW